MNQTHGDRQIQKPELLGSSEIHPEFSAGKAESLASAPRELMDMAAWSENHPPSEGWRSTPLKPIHLHSHLRVQIELQQARDISYGFARSEDLAELGVFAAELDSMSFAQGLLDAMRDELSIRNLQHLVRVFAGALKEEEDRRHTHRQAREQKIATQAG